MSQGLIFVILILNEILQPWNRTQQLRFEEVRGKRRILEGGQK